MLKSKIPKEIFIVSLKDDFEFSRIRTYNLIDTITNLEFEKPNLYFVGINGEKLVNKKINYRYISDKQYSFNLNIGTMACALSHALVLKFIQIKNLNTDILVLEEDALLNKNFCDIFQYIPNDYDIIYLHSYHSSNFYDQFDVKNTNLIFNSVKFKKIINPPNPDAPQGLNAFLINGKNINKILDNLLPFKEAADWHYLNQYYKLTQYYVNPDLQICNNPPFHSIRYAIDLKYENKIQN